MLVWLVNVGEDLADVNEYMIESGITLPVLSDPDGEFYNGYHREPAPGPFPVDVVVARDGTIAYLTNAYDATALRDVIDAELAE